jgi:NADH-quinone oxidoreductase subunit H
MTPELKGLILLTAIKLVVVFTVTVVGVALLTLMERKVSAWMQYRLGPNRVGFGGLLQPAADGVKNIIKEETFPGTANRVLFTLAPMIAFIPAMILGSIIQWAAPLPVKFDFTLPILGQFRFDGLMPMAVIDVPVGILLVLAISSMGVYGIALAGWSSNNKYSLLGGLRASAQMISYEVAMGLSLIPVILLTGSVSFTDIIQAQQQQGWFIIPLFLGFFIFLVSGFAETNRLPFDMPEAESELIAGYHTEYSAMKFSMFFIAEYSNMVTVSAMVTTLFLGGWGIPGVSVDAAHPGLLLTLKPGALATILTGAAMFLKVFFWLFFFMWIRWTLPRFRYDQLMALGWKVLMPIALAYIMLVALTIYVTDNLLGLTSVYVRTGALAVVNIALGYVVFMVFDRGLLISGSRGRDGAAGGLNRAA